jgi:butyryl-CoA dehydrogenase
MEFSYTEEQLMIKNMLREFAEKEIAPRAKVYDPAGEFPWDIVRKLGELGICGMVIPEQYGGSGSDTISYSLAMEELARVCPSTAVTLSVNNSVFCYPVFRFGTEAQKKKYLVPAARGEKIGGFAISEPGSGSDAASLKCRAEKKGNEYILNGDKAWITNVGIGEAFVLMATTNPGLGHKGICAFIVERSFPGFKEGKQEEKMGLKASKTASIILEDCRVPAENLLGTEGEGFKIALSCLDGARIGVASQAVGIAQGALDESVKYAKSREQFGRPIASFEAISFMLADMATQIEAARLLTHRAAALRDAGKRFTKEASMAKYYASETANRVTASAVQIHGAYGYSREYLVEKLFRDARVTTIYEGTSEIQKIVIARELFH